MVERMEWSNGCWLVQFRPPVLLAIDQVNGLYSRTAYYDVESKVVTADRFNLPRSFIRFLNGERKVRGDFSFVFFGTRRSFFFDLGGFIFC